MASKQQSEATTEDVEELLDTVDKTLDRLKTLYEQYFLGIQKQPPTFIHNDVERRLRDLTQLQIRNTGLRYRFATLQQKFGSYNSYWRRTLRQIESGTYTRNLQKIGREAVRTGANIPEEILAAMPKRMREQVMRDRDQALAVAKRRTKSDSKSDSMLPPEPTDDVIAMIKEPSELRRSLRPRTPSGTHILVESENDLDIDAFFAAVQEGTIPPPVSTVTSDLAKLAGAVTRTPEPAPAAKPPPPRPATVPGVAAPPPPPPPKPVVAPASPPRRPDAGLQRPDAGPQRPDAGPQRPATGPSPVVPPIPPPPPRGLPAIPRPAAASSQSSRPNPIAPGAAAAHGTVEVESLAGPFPRERERVPTPATGVPVVPKRVPAPAPQRPPPGMTDADVNVLYAKYIKAKEMIGEKIGPGEHSKLLKTINQQAPKIMAQYNAKGVDFSVVVKDNQVIIRAKPKG